MDEITKEISIARTVKGPRIKLLSTLFRECREIMSKRNGKKKKNEKSVKGRKQEC